MMPGAFARFARMGGLHRLLSYGAGPSTVAARFDPARSHVGSAMGIHGRVPADRGDWTGRPLLSLCEQSGDPGGVRGATPGDACRDSLLGHRRPFRPIECPPVEDRGGTEALQRLVLRLEALRAVRESDATYAVPELWRRPYTESRRTCHVDPIAFWLERTRTILATARQPMIEGERGEWSSSATVYNLFIRAGTGFDHNEDGRIEPLNANGVRETGTFMKALALLPYIRSLGCNVVHLLPVSRIGADGRKGALGSPYAVANPYALDETLCEPLLELGADEECRAFVEGAHRLGMRVVVEFVFRTAARDCIWAAEHPDWFYWIPSGLPDRGPDVPEGFGSPRFTEEELRRMKEQVARGDFADLPPPSASYRRLFIGPQSIRRVERVGDRWIGRTAGDVDARIPGAFADWPPDDDQPPWDDVTYLRLYDAPGFDYMAYNTVRMYDDRLAKPDWAIDSLWEAIVGVLPHYVRAYGIDGAMIDMGHALPGDLKRRMIQRVRRLDGSFALWDEDFRVTESARREGYNAVIGNLWWLIHRPDEFSAALREMALEGRPPLPVFAGPETHNTPRCAGRPGGIRRASAAWCVLCFLPAIPFVHGGFELGEVTPINTGLDFSSEATRTYPESALPLYNPTSFPWTAETPLVPLIRTTLSLRSTWDDPLRDASPEGIEGLDVPGRGGVGYVRLGREYGVLVAAALGGEPIDGAVDVPFRQGALHDPIHNRIHRVRNGRLELHLEPWEAVVVRGRRASPR